MVALAAAIGIGRFAFTPLLPMMQNDMGLTITAGGWVAAANYLGYFVGAISAVWLRASAVAVVRGALVCNALLIAAMGFTDGWAAWAGIRAASGIVSAWLFIFASTIVLKRLAELGRLELSSVMFAGVGIGITVSGVLCIGFVAAGVNSHHAWRWFALLALIATALLWRAFRGARDAAVRGRDRHAARPRWTRPMVLLILSYGLYAFGYIVPATFLPVIARDVLADPRLYVWFWPVCGIAAAVSTFASVPLARHYGDHALLLICFFAEAVGVLLPVAFPQAAGISAGAVLVGATFVVITVASLREASLLAPAHAGRLIAAMTASFALGQIAGPVVAAYLVDWRGSFSAALLLAAVALLLGAALLPRCGAREN
jgi:MFS family permease